VDWRARWVAALAGVLVGNVSLGDLRRSVQSQLGTAMAGRLGVLVAVAVLLPPVLAGAGGRPPPPREGTMQTVTSSLYSLQVDVYPVQLGEYNTLHMVAYTPEGKALRVLDWKVSATLPARGVEPIDTPVLGIEENVAVGAVSFPVPGDWQLRLTLRSGHGDHHDRGPIRTQPEQDPLALRKTN
jgi:copper transport protein